MLEVNKMFLTIDRLEQRVHELEKYRFVDMKRSPPWMRCRVAWKRTRSIMKCRKR